MIERIRARTIVAALARIRRPGPRARRWIMAGATIGFVAIVAWGVNGYRAAGLEVRLTLLIVAGVVGTPVALALNAIELRVMGSATKAELSNKEAVVATVFASAANSLPLPGSVVVRGWSLVDKGASLAEVVRVQAMAGLTFVATALLLTGPLLATSAPRLGFGIGLVGLVSVLILVIRAPRYVRRLMIVEAAMVGSELARFALVLAALDVEVNPGRAAGLVIANVLAVAVGVFPAGLGVREGLAALLASATALAAPVAVTVSVTDRVATSLVLAVLVATGWVIGFRPTSTAPREPSTDHPARPSTPDRLRSLDVGSDLS